jgi:protein O-mannosyl-transferase
MTAATVSIECHRRAFRAFGRPGAPALVAALAALLVYACTLRGTFVYDDVYIAKDDPRLAQVSTWRQFWTAPYMNGPDKLYRPLTSMTYALQHVWTGTRAWPFHLVNWLLHAAAAAAVAEFGRRLAGLRTAWAAGLLFAVHPIHVEAVAGIVGRAELLCALATLLGLSAFIGKPLSGGRIAFIAVCCAVAVLSKEQGVLFPALILALVPLRRSRPALKPVRPRKYGLWLTVTLCYLMAGYLLLREWIIGLSWDRTFLDWVMNPMIRSHGIDRALMPVVLAGRYLALLVAPHRQSVDYGAYVIGWTVHARDPYLYLGFFAVLLWVGLLIVALRCRLWPAVFCLVAFALTYGMTGNIVALIGTIFAERLMYAPSIYFILLVAMGLARLRIAMAGTLVVGLAVAGGLATFAYARLWNHPEALFARCARNQPGSERVYNLLFSQYVAHDKWWDARRVAHESVAAVPDSDVPYEMCIYADLKTGGSLADAWRTYHRGMNACSGFDRLYMLQFSDTISRWATTQPAAPINGPAPGGRAR